MNAVTPISRKSRPATRLWFSLFIPSQKESINHQHDCDALMRHAACC